MYAKNVWVDASKEKKEKIFSFAQDYIDFLSYGKTERLVVDETVKLLKEKGYK